MIDIDGVYPWIERRLRPWRGEYVVLTSPLPVNEVRRRLQAGLGTPWPRWFSRWAGGQVVGRLGEQWLRAEVTHQFHTPWRPVLHVRWESDGTGTRVAGSVGWSLPVKALAPILLSALTAVAVAAVGLILVDVVRGDAGTSDLPVIVVPVLLLLCVVPGPSDDAEALTSWLSEALATPEKQHRTLPVRPKAAPAAARDLPRTIRPAAPPATGEEPRRRAVSGR